MTPCRLGWVASGLLGLGATVLAQSAQPAASAPGPVGVEMRNVHLRADDGIALDVGYLRGQMVSRTAGEPPVFDDPLSYVLRVGAGEVSIDLPSLERLLNDRVFAGPKAPLTDIKLSISKDGLLEQSAKLHKGPLTLPVSMKAAVSASPDGRLKLHIETEKALGIPTTTLLAIFGLTAEDLVSLKNSRGVEIDGNDVYITIGLVTPPPQIDGRLAGAAIRDNRLVQTFAVDASAGATPLHLPIAAKNYLYFFGSVLRFGKLTMTDADLLLVDGDPKTPFDFYPREYLKQLVAGYSKTTPSGGLITYMPDYGRLRAVSR